MLFHIPIASRPIFLGTVARCDSPYLRGGRLRLVVGGLDYTGIRLNDWSDGDRTLFLVCPD